MGAELTDTTGNLCRSVVLLGGDKLEWKRYNNLQEREESQNNILELLKDFAND